MSNDTYISPAALTAILPDILQADLLYSVKARFADDLGYGTASSLDRLRSGHAGEKAVEAFVKRLHERMGLEPQLLPVMHRMIQDYKRFAASLKGADAALDPEFVVFSLLSGDCSGFSREWQHSYSHELMQSRKTDTDAFYLMLFYFYIHKRFPSLTTANSTFRQLSHELILPLAAKLQTIYPANEVGHEYVGFMQQDADRYPGEHLMLWRCIKVGATLLKRYGEADLYRDTRAACQLLPGVDERSYWLTSEPTQLLMLLTVPGALPRSGTYGVFTIDVFERSLSLIANMSLHPGQQAQIKMAQTGPYLLPKYTYRHPTLRFSTPNDADELARHGLGMAWKQLDITHNDELLDFDAALTDDHIQAAIEECYGVATIPELFVTDVMLSRTEVRLLTKSGKQLVINRNAYDFLATITPTDTVVVMRRKSDGYEFVEWTELSKRIGLREFSVGAADTSEVGL